MDLFEEKNISPMLLTQSKPPFDSNEYIFELKFDGIRCLAYIDNNTVQLLNKRQKDVSEVYPELANMFKDVKKKCILDGEIVCFKDGKPNFFTLQRRTLLTSKMRIRFESKENTVNFVAYDILYLDGENLVNKPLLDRKNILQTNILESNRLSTSKVFPDKGKELFLITKENGLEGIVAKRKDSKYLIGKRTKEWIKIKNLIDEDFLVLGYIEEDNSVKDIVIGREIKGEIQYAGTIYIGVSSKDQKSLLEYAKNHIDDAENVYKKEKPNAIWIKPKLVCNVQYMEKTATGSMRQPIFRGIRVD